MAIVWLFPLAWAIYTALRPYSDTQAAGYISLPQTLNFQNFIDAWNGGDFAQHFLSTLIVTIPAVIVTLIVASMVAFAVSRFSWRFNLVILLIFTAGNLLPPQVIIVPLFKLYTAVRGIPPPLSDNSLLYNQYFGVFLINFVFQLGFCTFVLSNYMKTISHELTEAALVDGASVLRIWGGVIMPLCRPGPRRARDAAVHVHLQRLLLGPDPDQGRRPATHHVGAQQPPGPVLHRYQPARGGGPARRDPDDPRVPGPAEALHQWPVARGDQGLIRAAGTGTLGGPHRMTPAPWADPELTSRGRLPMHAVPHDDRLPLDGRWRFQLLHRPDEAPGADWGEADVPGCWTMQDTWDHPIYTNVQMPFPHRPPETPEENPTGVYERSFEVPGGVGRPAGRAPRRGRRERAAGRAQRRRGRDQQGLAPGGRVRRDDAPAARARTTCG